MRTSPKIKIFICLQRSPPKILIRKMAAREEIHLFEQAIAVTLRQWTALSLAVEGEWGGPESGDKRDWLCGCLVERLKGRLIGICAKEQIPRLDKSMI